jgi:hypothetical protein
MTLEVSVAKAGGLSDEVTFSYQIACISPWVQRFWEGFHDHPKNENPYWPMMTKLEQQGGAER